MDGEIAELKRLRDADPADAEAARRYEAALLRAGQRDEVERLYTFKFQCDLYWFNLTETDDPNRRFCGNCKKSVYMVKAREEMADRVREGACVAFDPRSVDALAFLIEDRGFTSAEGQKTCLIDSSVAPLPFPSLGVPRAIEPGEQDEPGDGCEA